MISDKVAERLAQLRKAARFSREEFAEQCRRVGDSDFSAATLSNIETGRRDETGRRRRKVTADELVIFAAALGVPLSALIDDADVPAPLPANGAAPPAGEMVTAMRELTVGIQSLVAMIGQGPNR